MQLENKETNQNYDEFSWHTYREYIESRELKSVLFQENTQLQTDVIID